MQTAINTDVFITDVLTTLMGQMEQWAEQERLKQVQMVLYMHLMNKTILVDQQEGHQLPSEWVDDTPRVVEAFLQCLRLEKRTENTIVGYRGELRGLFGYVRKNYADITTNDIKGYLSWRQITKGNSDTTLNNKIHVFQSFFKWVMDEDLVEDGGFLLRKPKKNPMSKVHKIKTEKKIKAVLTDEQVEIIRCDCKHVRDRAIVEMLIATGMRVSELVGLDLADIDVNKKRCIVYGKGRKERAAFFTPRALVHLREYIDFRRKLGDDCPALFINLRRSAGGAYGRMLTDSVRGMLNAIVGNDPRLNGLNLHPHMFRAYLATYMARHGASINDIKNVLGHSNINTTAECYLIENVDETQEVHKKCAA